MGLGVLPKILHAIWGGDSDSRWYDECCDSISWELRENGVYQIIVWLPVRGIDIVST